MMNIDTSWKDRVRQERDELNLKMYNLGTFLTVNRSALDVDTENLLERQLRAMAVYRDVLDERIERKEPHVPQPRPRGR